MTLLDVCLSENLGIDSGNYPYGVPTSYSWYSKGSGPPRGFISSPIGFTSLTGWTHIFPQVGQINPPVGSHIFVKNFQTYVHLDAGGWVKVQDQSQGLGGSFFLAAISPANLTAPGMSFTPQSDGSAMINAPQQGLMAHFWVGPRGVYPVNGVNAVFVKLSMRVDDPNCKLVAMAGADWWLNSSAPFLSSFANNPGVGLSDWIPLTTTYQDFMFCHLTRSQLTADPPAPLVSTVVVPPAPAPAPAPAPTPVSGNVIAVLQGPTMPLPTTGDVEGAYYNIYTNGTLSQNVIIPQPTPAVPCNIVVNAHGSVAMGVWPIMQLLIDDQVVGSATVGSTTDADYTFSVPMPIGTHKIGVGFINDAQGPNGEDRNLYIKTITIQSQ